MEKEFICAPPCQGEPVIYYSGQKLKADLLVVAAGLPPIDNSFSRSLSLSVASQLTDLLKRVEESRKEAKEPFLRIGKAIDAAAKTFVVEAREALDAINSGIAKFDMDQEERLRMAKTVGQKMVERDLSNLEAQLTEAQINYETILKEMEFVDKQITAMNGHAGIELTKKSLALEDAAEVALKELRELNNFIKKLKAPTTDEEPVPTGGRTSTDYDIEITDIEALAKAFPHCVKLTPLLSNIKAMLHNGMTLPGVKATEKRVFTASRAFGKAVNAGKLE